MVVTIYLFIFERNFIDLNNRQQITSKLT